MDTYIVNVSSGLASAEALERTIARVGKEYTIGVFADVKGRSTHEHAGEDVDNYRFLADIERWFGLEIVRIVEGRDIWQAMFDARAITLPVGKSKVARCSIDLKRNPIDRWVTTRYTPDTCVLVAGLDWAEPHRIADFTAAKAARYTPLEHMQLDYPETIEESLRINETASHRIIGLTIETRPEYVTDVNCQYRRSMGITRLEMGVQSLDDTVLDMNKRGHGTKEIFAAMHKLRQYGSHFLAKPGMTPCVNPSIEVDSGIALIRESGRNENCASGNP
jgi:hypothetical protein